MINWNDEEIKRAWEEFERVLHKKQFEKIKAKAKEFGVDLGEENEN